MQNRGLETEGGSLAMVPSCDLNHLCQVQGLAIRALPDLLAAAEAVCDNQTVGRRFPDRWQKFEFADGE